MAEGDGLRGLEVREARHHRRDMRLRLREERAQELRDLAVRAVMGLAHP